MNSVTFIETQAVQQALVLAQTLLGAEQNRVGKIDGKPGTGKSTLTHYLVRQLQGVRVCAYQGMSTKALMQALGLALALDNTHGTAASLVARLRPHVQGRLVIIDEANHLKWPQMEGLRYLADEAGMALLLVGTELMNRPFRTPQTGIYLAQLASRIGAKTLRLTRMRRIEECQGYVLQPLFGQVERGVAKRFLHVSQGYWRDSLELAQACQRLMSAHAIAQLTLEVVETAAQWMSEGRQAASHEPH